MGFGNFEITKAKTTFSISGIGTEVEIILYVSSKKLLVRLVFKLKPTTALFKNFDGTQYKNLFTFLKMILNLCFRQ